jgi:uncharacterized membrane protein
MTMDTLTALHRTGSRPAIRLAQVLTAAIIVACVGVVPGTLAADSPARPLATALATTNHAAFPLVVADTAGVVRLPLTELSDGAAHFYTVMVGDLPVEFFAIWTPDNVIRTAYNACDVCFRAKLGYRQEGLFMVCNNCGNRFPVGKIDTVNGGCNPAPLAAHIDGQELVIAPADLVAGLSYFP